MIKKIPLAQPDAILQYGVWYEKPAKEWLVSLPVGNGRLGTVVIREFENERIKLIEDLKWSGGPDWENLKGIQKI